MDDRWSPRSDERIARAELVQRAGVEDDLVDRLVVLAILEPDAQERFHQADVYRARLVEACEKAGLGADAIAHAIQQGQLSLAFLDNPQYQWAPLSTETYGAFAERLGLPLDVVQDVAAAFGRRRPAASDRMREDEESIYELITSILPLANMDELAGMGRVYVDGLRRMAEAEAGLFDQVFVGGLMRTGLSYRDAIERASAMTAEVGPLLEQMLIVLYRRQQERGWTEGIVEGIERLVEEAGVYRAPQRPTALAFVDLAGYTRLTDQHGDEESARVASDLSRLVDREATEHDGTPVKWLGDGVMVHFRDAASAVRATLSMVEGAPSIGLPAHAGVAAGPVVMQDGDYFGRTVNLAARIASGAEAGQTLVNGLVAELAGGPDLSFREIDAIDLKGFAEPVRAYEARRAP